MEWKLSIDQYCEELLDGTAALFVGAGISLPSNLPGWSELLTSFAASIGINDIDGKDLPLIAQYVINENTGNRGPFINAISKKIRKKYSPNNYHKLIAKTNVRTIWTTNYDNLIETAFANHIINLKTNDDAISRDVPDAQVEIIKMHGCIFNSDRNDIVVTESDYEDFFINKPATAQRLKLDLLQKSFLFIGYGYNDSNIKNIITEARRLSKNSTRQHYLVTKKEDSAEFKLWCNNLKKYGIIVIPINDYPELEEILERISLKSRGKSVFVTGSHSSTENEEAQILGRALAEEKEIILIDGQSTGVMRCATTSFLEKCVAEKKDINKHLKFFANPYAANQNFSDDVSLIPMLKQWRIPLFKQTQIFVAFDGGMGTKAEIEIAKDMGCIIIPYFKSKESELSLFLNDTEILRRLEVYNKEYITKAKKFDVKIKDVIDLIKEVLEKI